LSTHHGKTAKSQKATTTPFLYFPGKDVPDLVLNKKDPRWGICTNSRTFLYGSEHSAMSRLMRDRVSTYSKLCQLSKHRLRSARIFALFTLYKPLHDSQADSTKTEK